MQGTARASRICVRQFWQRQLTTSAHARSVSGQATQINSAPMPKWAPHNLTKEQQSASTNYRPKHGNAPKAFAFGASKPTAAFKSPQKGSAPTAYGLPKKESLAGLGKELEKDQKSVAPAVPTDVASNKSSTASNGAAASSTTRPRRKLRPRKAVITLSKTAVDHLRRLLDQPEPKLVRIGVQNRGCSGLTYHLEYVDKPAQFDEEVVQDGVRVIVDSKALFSIIGSEMDWVDDKLHSKFIFRNPNSKGQCGCGESFMV